MRVTTCLVAMVVGVFGASVSISDDRVPLEADVELEASSRGWINTGPAPKDAMIRLTLAVTQRNVKAMTALLLKVSDPRNPAYGQHLSKEHVDRLVAPAPESVAAVQRFLQAHGVTDCSTSSNSDFVHCEVTVATAERMLATRYFTFAHSADASYTVIRAGSHYTVPRGLAAHLDFVSPTNRFPPVRTARTVATAAKKPEAGSNTPESLRKLYSVGDVEGSAPSNKLACTAFLEQFFKVSDLDKFYKQYYTKAVGRTVKVIGPNSGPAGVEASLDIEYMSTMGGGVESEFWSFAGRAPGNPENEPFLTWIELMGNTSDADIPKVFSTSYGEAEDTVSMAYMNRIEAELQKVGARGITLFFASGDSGVVPDSGSCKNGRFAGQWPAGSPWVTGVGGTEFGFLGSTEKAWGGSSGGFSDRWARPSFQATAVDAYLRSGISLPDSSHYNSTSRGFPDVSAQATNFLVINDGFTEPVAGTSCASPTFGGLFALLNDLRLQNGKSTLGFVNPLFYQNPTIFNDITEGENQAGPGCGNEGFKAAKGWDPVTGLGTPNYAKMKEVVMALP